MARRFASVGVLPQSRTRLVHGHGTTSAGWVSTKRPLVVLWSAGSLPSQCSVFTLQGVKLRRTKHLSLQCKLRDDLLTKSRPKNNRVILLVKSNSPLRDPLHLNFVLLSHLSLSNNNIDSMFLTMANKMFTVHAVGNL